MHFNLRALTVVPFLLQSGLALVIRAEPAQIQSGGTYYLLNAQAPDACVDLSLGDNRSVIAFPYHGGDNQKWTFTQEGDGWTIKNVMLGTYLASDGAHGKGVHVIGSNDVTQWAAETDNQATNGYRFYVPGTNLDLDLTGHGNSTPGNQLTTYGKMESRSQSGLGPLLSISSRSVNAYSFVDQCRNNLFVTLDLVRNYHVVGLRFLTQFFLTYIPVKLAP